MHDRQRSQKLNRTGFAVGFAAPVATGILCALMLSACSLKARANPVDTGTVIRLNDLPYLVTRSGSLSDRADFVKFLARFGIDAPLLYRKNTLQFMDSNFVQLKPYFLEAERSALDEGMQAWFRARGTAADRDSMCLILVQRLDGTQAGVRVAGMLADWAYTPALGPIDSLAADSSISADFRGYFERSAQRLRNPCSVGFLVPDGHGGIRICRQLRDLVSMTFLAPQKNIPACTQPLDTAEVAQLWSLLSRGKEGRHSRWFEGGWGIHFEFRDGLKADLKPTDSKWFNYTDSSRGGWWSHVIENPPLYEAVKECLPERPLPQYDMDPWPGKKR